MASLNYEICNDNTFLVSIDSLIDDLIFDNSGIIFFKNNGRVLINNKGVVDNGDVRKIICDRAKNM